MNKARGKRKTTKNNFDSMPYGYRTKVVEMLTAKGIQVTASQVFDIKRGKTNYTDLTIAVLKALKKVQREHLKEVSRLKKLRAA